MSEDAPNQAQDAKKDTPCTLDAAARRKLEVEMGRLSQKAADDFDKETKLPHVPLEVLSYAQKIEYLGAGAFNQIYKVKVGDRMLARKGLKAGIKNKAEDFKAGALDLVHEVKLLNTLSHPNILHLRGVSSDTWSESYLDDKSFYMYLDLLSPKGDILEHFEDCHYASEVTAMNWDMHRRLDTIALPIAKALAYLHEKQIIFRDIKPANMGFDVNGVVKLYDFGMAREVNPDRKMTGRSGTILYMAPEVALSQHYGLSADVYSFAMFLFECCTLKKPCVELILAKKDHFELVVNGNYRPKMDDAIFTDLLRELLDSGWARDPICRPTMQNFVTKLDGCIVDVHATLEAMPWFPSWPAFSTFTSEPAIIKGKELPEMKPPSSGEVKATPATTTTSYFTPGSVFSGISHLFFSPAETSPPSTKGIVDSPTVEGDSVDGDGPVDDAPAVSSDEQKLAPASATSYFTPGSVFNSISHLFFCPADASSPPSGKDIPDASTSEAVPVNDGCPKADAKD